MAVFAGHFFNLRAGFFFLRVAIMAIIAFAMGANVPYSPKKKKRQRQEKGFLEVF
jgi:hypothetical protein